jgi:hypothetical protein
MSSTDDPRTVVRRGSDGDVGARALPTLRVIGWWCSVLLVMAWMLPACQPVIVQCGERSEAMVIGASSTDVRRTESARPRGAVVTAAGPQMRAILEHLALPTFQRFARRWGYAVLAEELPTDGAGADPAAQQAKWAKLRLLREALASFPLALWLDADILLTRDDEDIASHLHADHFQALALEQVPYEHRVNPNTGVWLLRSCPAAFAFLGAVSTAGPQPGPWADQGAVLAALDWDRGDQRYRWARPGRGNQFLAGTSCPLPTHGRRRQEAPAPRPRPATARAGSPQRAATEARRPADPSAAG